MKVQKILFLILFIFSTTKAYAQWEELSHSFNFRTYVFLNPYYKDFFKEQIEINKKNKVKRAVCKDVNEKTVLFEVEFNENGEPVMYSSYKENKVFRIHNLHYNDDGSINSVVSRFADNDAEDAQKMHYNNNRLEKISTFVRDEELFSTQYTYENETDMFPIRTKDSGENFTDTFLVKSRNLIEIKSPEYGNGFIADEDSVFRVSNLRGAYYARKKIDEKNWVYYKFITSMAPKEFQTEIIDFFTDNNTEFAPPDKKKYANAMHYLYSYWKINYDERKLPLEALYVDNWMYRHVMQYEYEYF